MTKYVPPKEADYAMDRNLTNYYPFKKAGLVPFEVQFNAKNPICVMELRGQFPCKSDHHNSERKNHRGSG